MEKNKIDGNLKRVWARVGFSMLLTPEQIAQLESGNIHEADFIKLLLETGYIDGETYFPEEAEENPQSLKGVGLMF